MTLQHRDPAPDPHDHGHGHGPDHDHDHGHDHEHGLWARVRHALVPHSHDHAGSMPTSEESSAIGIRAAWISLAGMGATALLQIVIVWLSGSVALLADTLHNLGHLATTIPLIIAFRLGRRRPTRRYSYGFRRAEDLVGLLIGAVIALSAALIVWESVRALSEQRDMTHLGWVLAAALVGAAGNEVVARYRIRAGRRIGSAALVAEGQHARTDALTSLAVVLGVVGAWLGLPWVDPVVGLLIATWRRGSGARCATSTRSPSTWGPRPSPRRAEEGPVPEERWLVVDGRRWRRQDPALPEDVARRLLSHLGRGRSGVRALRAAGEDPSPARRRVDLAKHGLGERGTPWWEQDDAERRQRWEDALALLDALDGGD